MFNIFKRLFYKPKKLSPKRITKCLYGVSPNLGQIYKLLEDKNSAYKTYFIKKSDGGKRQICEPINELKNVQKRLRKFIFEKPVSKYCAAYERGMSIKKNAERHIKGKHILHLDIKNFFPSINKDMFLRTYGNTKVNIQDLELAWNIVSLNGGLPIGAVTSPFVANRILYELDESLAKIEKSLTYSRYADDMIFSSKNYIDKAVISKIEKLIYLSGFTVNQKKTYFMSGNRKVTGLTITNDCRLTVGLAYKKEMKKLLYDFLNKGIGKKKVVIGKFTHLKNIEPKYAETLKEKYKKFDKDGFFKFL